MQNAKLEKSTWVYDGWVGEERERRKCKRRRKQESETRSSVGQGDTRVIAQVAIVVVFNNATQESLMRTLPASASFPRALPPAVRLLDVVLDELALWGERERERRDGFMRRGRGENDDGGEEEEDEEEENRMNMYFFAHEHITHLPFACAQPAQRGGRTWPRL